MTGGRSALGITVITSWLDCRRPAVAPQGVVVVGSFGAVVRHRTERDQPNPGSCRIAQMQKWYR